MKPDPRWILLHENDEAGIDWFASRELRTRKAALKRALSALAKAYPELARERFSRQAERCFEKARETLLREILLHPFFLYWLHRAGLGASDRDRSRKAAVAAFLFLRGFAASLALKGRLPLETEGACDEHGRFHFHGIGAFLAGGEEAASKPVRLQMAGGELRIALPGEAVSRFAVSRLIKALEEGGQVSSRASRAKPRWKFVVGERVGRGIELNGEDPLLRALILEHDLYPEPGPAFTDRLEEALKVIRSIDDRLADELKQNLRVIVPLKQPKPGVSVSSSYREFRWGLGLSHYNDPVVQAETLIHEFSHSKLFAAAESSPLLAKPGKAAYYSPLKSEPRPLFNILLGAHAFLNVSLFYQDYLDRFQAKMTPVARGEIQWNISRRLLEAHHELSCVSQNADLTPLGKDFLALAHRELGKAWVRAESFPASIHADAERYLDGHRKKYSAYPSYRFREAEPVPKKKK